MLHTNSILQRFEIHTHWNKLHIFVMNLAVADLCYCAIPLPFYLTLYFSNEWIFGEIWCKIIAIAAHIFGYGGWTALSVIAFVRVVAVWSPQILRRICTDRGSKIIILIQWLFTILLLLPSFFEVRNLNFRKHLLYNKTFLICVIFFIHSEFFGLWLQLLQRKMRLGKNWLAIKHWMDCNRSKCLLGIDAENLLMRFLYTLL